MGGTAPLVLAGFIYWLMPESPRLLARRDPQHAGIRAALQKLGVSSQPSGASFMLDEAVAPSRLPAVDLFRGGRAPLTLTLWLASALSLSGIMLTGLLPTFYHQMAGVPLADFAKVLSLSLVGSLTAAVSAGFIVGRLGPHQTLLLFAATSAACFTSVAFLPFGSVAFAALLFVAGFAQNGAQQSLNILSPTLYPSHMRATAVGWKAGIGKLASSGAPLAGAMLLTHATDVRMGVFFTAAPLFLLALCAPLLGRNVRAVSR
jgi:AAHS family 4-hydroxybenzoate transporter-like MFS transporter